MRLLKEPKEILENVVAQTKTADYIIGYNTKDSNITSSGYSTFNLGQYLGSLKTITTVFSGFELLESERFLNVINLLNIENDKKYIVLQLHSQSEELKTKVYIFDNIEDYNLIKDTIDGLFINMHFI